MLAWLGTAAEPSQPQMANEVGLRVSCKQQIINSSLFGTRSKLDALFGRRSYNEGINAEEMRKSSLEIAYNIPDNSLKSGIWSKILKICLPDFKCARGSDLFKQ